MDGTETKFDAAGLAALLGDPAAHQVFVDAVAQVIYGDVFKRDFDSFDVDRLQFFAAGIASSQYAARHMGAAIRAANALALLDIAADVAPLGDGLVLEFGVYSGRTINHLADRHPDTTIFGFDSFEGLPETWRPGFERGEFALPEPPAVRDNVELVVGWFDRTLPAFLDQHPGERIALLHVDCDLYSSTQVVFQQLKPRIGPGTVIVFDEYFNYPGWDMHEFRAFQEFVTAHRIHYDYIGLVPGHQQVAVKIVA